MTTRNSRASKRWMVAAAAAVACGSTLAISGAASAGPGPLAPTPERISGANRYGTAAAISLNQDDTYFTVVNGQNFPDGLASSIYGDNILLTQRDALPAETLAELNRVKNGDGIDNIRVVGGVGAVSSAVFEQLSVLANGSIQRVAGIDRYKTAIAVATDNIPTDTVILATGTNFPDALAAGPLALEEGAPILLNNGTAVRSDVAAFLLSDQDLVTPGVQNVKNVIIVGGKAAIPTSVQTQLEGSLGLSVTRLSGVDRAATAVAIANQLQVLADYTTGVTAVNGNSFADALASGPYAYYEDRPILLVNKDSIPSPTAAYHIGNCLTIADITAIGGTGVISDAVVTGAVNAATCAVPSIVSATLANSDFKQAVFTINAATTVTAKAGTPADGAAANAWQIALIQNGDSNQDKVVVVADGEGFGGVPTFVISANLPGLTNAGFVQIWNAGAGSITTAVTTSPATLVSLPIGGTEALPVLVPAGTLLTTPGSQDTVVQLTFSRPVSAAIPSGLFPNVNPATPSTLGLADTTSALPATSVKYTWNDRTSAAPTVGSYQIRFNPNNIVDAASMFANPAIVAKTLSAP